MGFAQRSAWAAVLLCASAIAMPQLSEKPRATSQPEMRVDLNSASMEELLQVPGMTRTWASRIVRYRPYHAKNELLDRGIVTSEVYSRIKEYIVAHRNK
jgi:competence protein ComEA